MTLNVPLKQTNLGISTTWSRSREGGRAGLRKAWKGRRRRSKKR
jgi:hypothetical protein